MSELALLQHISESAAAYLLGMSGFPSMSGTCSGMSEDDGPEGMSRGDGDGPGVTSELPQARASSARIIIYYCSRTQEDVESRRGII